MTPQQITSRIKKVLDNVPKNVPEEILSWLEEIQGMPAKKNAPPHHI